jgi:hypothetical protein
MQSLQLPERSLLARTAEAIRKIIAALGNCFSCRRRAVERFARQNEKTLPRAAQSSITLANHFLLGGDMSRWLDRIFQRSFLFLSEVVQKSDLRVVRFSTFATISTNNGSEQTSLDHLICAQ